MAFSWLEEIALPEGIDGPDGFCAQMSFELAALAAAMAAREAVLDRLAWQIAELRASLERCAVAHAAMAAELIS